MPDYPEEYRDPETIKEEMQSAKETAEELEDNERHIDAIATMVVYRTLRWVSGEGEEELNDELLEIDSEET